MSKGTKPMIAYHKRFAWESGAYAGFRAQMPGDVTLVVTPDRTRAFGAKAARGTTWHAQASHWCEATSTMSRFGRDEYAVKHATAKDAIRAAEAIFNDASRESEQ
jgi:hypothetical protein